MTRIEEWGRVSSKAWSFAHALYSGASLTGRPPEKLSSRARSGVFAPSYDIFNDSRLSYRPHVHAIRPHFLRHLHTAVRQTTAFARYSHTCERHSPTFAHPSPAFVRYSPIFASHSHAFASKEPAFERHLPTFARHLSTYARHLTQNLIKFACHSHVRGRNLKHVSISSRGRQIYETLTNDDV